MKTELDILKDVIEKLSTLSIPYMLTGSLAMMYYAQPRMTRDIDIVVELSRTHIDDFVRIFKTKYYISSEAIEDAVATPFIFNLIHLESSVKVDFVVRKSEEYRVVEFNRRKKVKIDGIELFVVSKEDLILSKLIWLKDSDSELQKRDILNLLESFYDKEYLFEWAKKLNLYTLLMSLKNE
jgi:hypothetical protein